MPAHTSPLRSVSSRCNSRSMLLGAFACVLLGASLSSLLQLHTTIGVPSSALDSSLQQRLRLLRGDGVSACSALSDAGDAGAALCARCAQRRAAPVPPSATLRSTCTRDALGFVATFPDGVQRRIPYQSNSSWPIATWIDGWWEGSFPGWHRATFAAFHAYLSSGHFSTYIGFGEWIGPTVLFSSSYVERAYAIEPDPAAVSFLRANVAANPAVQANTHVSALCIAPQPGVLSMRGEGASGSWLDGLVKKDSVADAKWAASHPDAIFDVPCVTLAMYVDEHEIDLARTFIKIDTEGAEWSLLPSLHALMAALPPGRRPTIILSPHATALREPSLGALLDFVRLFKFASQWAPAESPA